MTEAGALTAPAVVVGLGNPGPQYARNRHNAGFMAIDVLAADAGCGPWDLRCRTLVAPVVLEGRHALLAKPQTYMNLSGAAVSLLAANLELAPRDFVVILDDVNLPFGRLRVRPGGSAGGHHGLESILELLASKEVPRIRMGIGEENMPADKAEFVLSDFPPESEHGLRQMIGNAAAAARMMVTAGIARTMSVYNA